jgi:hypothetical protein
MANHDPHSSPAHDASSHDDHSHDHNGHDDDSHGHAEDAGEIIPENSLQDWMLSVLLPVLAFLGMLMVAGFMWQSWEIEATAHAAAATVQQSEHGHGQADQH